MAQRRQSAGRPREMSLAAVRACDRLRRSGSRDCQVWLILALERYFDFSLQPSFANVEELLEDVFEERLRSLEVSAWIKFGALTEEIPRNSLSRQDIRQILGRRLPHHVTFKAEFDPPFAGSKCVDSSAEKGSPAEPQDRSWYLTAGTSTWISMRSRRGPEMRSR